MDKTRKVFGEFLLVANNWIESFSTPYQPFAANKRQPADDYKNKKGKLYFIV